MTDPIAASPSEEPEDTRQCTARAKSTGARCRGTAIIGGTVCWKHGGSAPQVRAAAAGRAAVAKLAKSMPRWEPRTDLSPREVLALELGRSVAVCAWLTDQIDALDAHALVWGTAQHRYGSGPEGPVDVRTDAAVPHALVVWWREERKHLLAVAKASADAGVDERRVELQAAQARLLVAQVSMLVAELGHDAGAPETRQAMAGFFRRLDAIEAAEAQGGNNRG